MKTCKTNTKPNSDLKVNDMKTEASKKARSLILLIYFEEMIEAYDMIMWKNLLYTRKYGSKNIP